MRTRQYLETTGQTQKEDNVSAPCELIGPLHVKRTLREHFHLMRSFTCEKNIKEYFQIMCLQSGCPAVLAPKDFIGHGKARLSIPNIIFQLI